MDRFNVLAIDDEPDVLKILQIILERAGFGVHTSSNADDGLRIAFDEVIHIILLDIRMPMRDGFDLLEELKSSEKTRDIPVIMLTGEKQIKDFERGHGLGVADYITKPFRQDLLLQRIRRAIYYSLKSDELDIPGGQP
ncbi:MAG: response regulator [Planctomycetota bacterium]|jgi:DNA-binding response OmpR family regulator